MSGPPAERGRMWSTSTVPFSSRVQMPQRLTCARRSFARWAGFEPRHRGRLMTGHRSVPSSLVMAQSVPRECVTVCDVGGWPSVLCPGASSCVAPSLVGGLDGRPSLPARTDSGNARLSKHDAAGSFSDRYTDLWVDLSHGEPVRWAWPRVRVRFRSAAAGPHSGRRAVSSLSTGRSTAECPRIRAVGLAARAISALA